MLRAVWLIESLHSPGGRAWQSGHSSSAGFHPSYQCEEGGGQNLGPASPVSPCLNCSEDHLVPVGGPSVLGRLALHSEYPRSLGCVAGSLVCNDTQPLPLLKTMCLHPALG